MMAPSILLASVHVGPIQFDAPHWLLLFPILGAAAAWMGRRSLAGLGPVTRWVALAVRLIVIALLTATLAEPQWRTESKDVAVTVVMDVSQSVPGGAQNITEKYIEQAVAVGKERPDDRIGIVTAGKDAFVQALPSRLTRLVERQHVGALDGTNLAAAVRLAMAVRPQDAANCIVMSSDGNETVGSILQAAEAAKAAGVPIHILPLTYKYESEVLMDRLIAPATARSGENVSLKVVLQATRPAKGRLSILMNGQPIDLDPDSPAMGTPVELKQGLNVLTQTIAPPRDGPQTFEAVFEAEMVGGRPTGDVIQENNRAPAVTFVVGKAKVLVITDSAEESEHILRVMAESKIETEVRTSDQMPATLAEMAGYDAIVMVNQDSYPYSQKQQEDLRQYIHDTGGGLVMVGGPESFGAGGWIGSPLEDALPIKLDPPQKRQMPRGALALVMHSVEIPEGVYHGKKVCEAAVNALSRQDYIGINEYNWNGGTEWVFPLQVVGDGSAVKRAIQNLVFGDMPDFQPSLELAYKGLMSKDAGQRHVIIISDGDPAAPRKELLDQYRASRITISTVGVATHSVGDVSKMKAFSEYTGGKHYEVPRGKLALLPQIFVKEAQTVKRSLIWEGPPFVPKLVGGAVETMRGIPGVPAISGYVVAADREGLSQVILRGKENDPILAQWQYGLGKSITFTSEATSRWTASWITWTNFKAFWEQQVRWAMRPAGSPNIKVTTENKGAETVVSVQAFDTKGEPLNFANFVGRIATPDGKGRDVLLPQIGPGRYETVVPTADAGSYVASFIYTAPGINEGEVVRGSVQAALTRPFADEYRTLEDNLPLLKQVAAMTNGRILSGDPVKDDLWSRVGLTMPVATRPIWMFFALSAIGLFVIDVGVRRVRVDLAAIGSAIQRAISPGRRKVGQQMAGLRAAREGARQKIAQRSGPEAEAAKAVESAKSLKFEATPQQRTRAAPVIPLETPGAASAKPAGAQSSSTDKPAKPADAPGDMSRLLKAKKRAQSELKDQ